MSPGTGYNPAMNYYLGVNEDIRAAFRAALKAENVSQSELARRAGVPRQNVSRALAGDDPQGKVPPIWVKMLDALGYELTVKKKDGGS